MVNRNHNSDSYINIQLEKEIERLRKQELLEAVIEATTYKKGNTTKEVFNLPMPSMDEFLSDINISVKTYGSFMLYSNWGGTFLNPTDRYIYKEVVNKDKIQEICENLEISESTLKRNVNKLLRCKVDILEVIKTKDNKLIYKLNYCTINENGKKYKYVLISNVALRKLINGYSEYALKVYLLLLYKCRDTEVCLTQQYICEKIGLKPSSRKIVSDAIEALYCGKFINIRFDYNLNNRENKDGLIVNHVIPNYYYSLSNEYLKPKKRERIKD